MEIILSFLAKPVDKHGITLVHIAYPPLVFWYMIMILRGTYIFRAMKKSRNRFVPVFITFSILVFITFSIVFITFSIPLLITFSIPLFISISLLLLSFFRPSFHHLFCSSFYHFSTVDAWKICVCCYKIVRGNYDSIRQYCQNSYP